MFQLVELAKGSPVSPRTEMMGQQIGIAMLLMLDEFCVLQRHFAINELTGIIRFEAYTEQR